MSSIGEGLLFITGRYTWYAIQWHLAFRVVRSFAIRSPCNTLLYVSLFPLSFFDK